MSRFEHLEIEAQTKQVAPADSGLSYDEVHYSQLARKSEFQGEFETALRYYSRSLQYKTEHLPAWLGQIFCLIDLGEFHEAVVWAERGLEILGEQKDILATKAMAIGRQGDLGRALAYSDQAMRLPGPAVTLWLCRGDLLMAEDIRKAEFCLSKALENDRQNPYTYLRAAISCLSVRQADDALEYLSRARELYPKGAFIHFLIGQAQAVCGQNRLASQAWQNALKLNPQLQVCADAIWRLQHQGTFGWIGTTIRRLLRRND
jgi:tetratricopeptide (TPR) repeat protein